MFSPRERELLRLLAAGDSTGGGTDLTDRFPSAGYRRRLFWGIRRKAATAAGDWDLYLRAADRDPRVVPGSEEGREVPLYPEPFAALLRRIFPPAHGTDPSTAAPVRGHP